MNTDWLESHVLSHTQTLEDLTFNNSLQHMDNQHLARFNSDIDFDKNFYKQFKKATTSL